MSNCNIPASYDIYLGQGDTDNVKVILYEDGSPVDLTGSEVVFNMQNRAGVEISITCNEGIDPPAAQGGIIVPFNESNTNVSGEFIGNFISTMAGMQRTFPSVTGYIRIYIWESIIEQ